jgi:hypothetical protein
LRPNQQFAFDHILDNSGDSNYHAAQFTLRTPVSAAALAEHGLTRLVNRSTINRSIQSALPQAAVSRRPTRARPTGQFVTSAKNAAVRFDRTHVFTGASVWEVPVGKGRRFLTNASGVVNQILGGWTINTIYTQMSGEPFAVRSGAFTSNGSHEGRAGVQAPVKAQLQELPNSPLADQCFSNRSMR